MIVYDKAFKIMEEKGLSSYKIRKDNIISQSALQSLRENKHINTVSIDKLCQALECQPGDLMEYIPNSLDTETE